MLQLASPAEPFGSTQTLGGMEIIDVLWEGRAFDEPWRLISLLDSQRFEIRKLEFFRSGEVGSANESHETSRTALGSVAVPPLEEINTTQSSPERRCPQPSSNSFGLNTGDDLGCTK